MKKLIYILLFITSYACAQTTPVTMQFRSFGQRYPIYTWSGIPGGGYDTLWNAAKIRDYVATAANGIINQPFTNAPQTASFTISGFGLSAQGFASGNLSNLNAGLAQLSYNGISISGGGYGSFMNPNKIRLGVINDIVNKKLEITYDSLGRRTIITGDTVRFISRLKSDFIPISPNDVIRLQDVGGVIPVSGFATKDSTLNPNKDLYDIPNKATARLNLSAQRSTFVNALDFVSDTTGITDVTTGLQSAINATKSGGTLWIPRGKYLVSGSLTTGTKKITIRGDNGNLTYNNPTSLAIDSTGTLLISNSTTNTLLTIAGVGSNLYDIAFVCKSGITPTASTAVDFTNGGYLKISNCNFSGFYTNMKINNGNFWSIIGSVFSSPVNLNLFIASPSNGDIGDTRLTNSFFVLNNNNAYNIEYQSSGGLNIEDCKFVNRGVANPTNPLFNANLLNGTSDLNISNSSFEGFSGNAIKFRNINGVAFFNIQLHNNQFTSGHSNTLPIIDIKGPNNIMIDGNIITGGPLVNTTPAILIDSTQNVHVKENLITAGWPNKLSLLRSSGATIDTLTYYALASLTNGAETFTGQKTLIQPLKMQSGQGTGGLIMGADVNNNTLSASTRKLGRIVTPSYNLPATNTVFMAGTDNNGTANILSLGGANAVGQYAATEIELRTGATTTTTAGTTRLQINSAGNVGIGLTNNTQTAKVHIAAGTATANTAPLKFIAGVNLTTPEAGAFEWDGSRAYITSTTGPTRNTLAYLSDVFTNPMTTLGDIIYGGASGAPTRLAGNTATSRQFLTSTGNGTISAAPSYFNLFGTANTWGPIQLFNAGIGIGTAGGVARSIAFNMPDSHTLNLYPQDAAASNSQVIIPSSTLPSDTLALKSDLAKSVDNILSKTADYTIVSGDFVPGKKRTLDLYVDATAGNVTITMPNASTFAGYTIYVTKTDASVNSVTVNTVLGGSTILTQYQSRQFNSNSTSWFNH